METNTSSPSNGGKFNEPNDERLASADDNLTDHEKMNDTPTPTAEATDGRLPARACCASFEREYLGMPYTPTEEEIRLRELAEEYHRTCEDYDRTICTGPIKDGSILPASGAESAAINRHAQAVRDELFKDVAPLGFSRQQWMEAIRDAVLHYRHNAKCAATGSERNDHE